MNTVRELKRVGARRMPPCPLAFWLGPSPTQVRGFTLIEMLLAVAICAIVLVAINGVFATAVRLRDKTSETVEDSLPVNRAFDTIARDLKGTFGPGGWFQGDFRCGVQAVGATMGLTGEAGNAGLDFYTTTGSLNDKTPFGDAQEVLYQLKAPTDNQQTGMDLVRCVNRNVLATVTQTPDVQCLLSHVQTVQFDCYDGNLWRNTWDTSSTDTNLPVAVRIRIQLAPKEGENSGNRQPLEMLVPLTTQTRATSSTSSTSTTQ